MTPEQIGIALTEITTLLVDKIGERPYLRISAWIDDSGRATINLYRGLNGGDYDLGRVRSTTFEGLFDEARKFIAALPSEKERDLREFNEGVAKLIDMGHEKGIDDEFVRPLKAVREAMTENLLTYQVSS